MKRFVLCALVLVLLPFSVFAADDILGWKTTRWGMSEKEVEKVAGPGLVRLDPPDKFSNAYASFTQPTRINRYTLEVIYQFDKDAKKLSQVLLRGEGADAVRWSVLKDWLTDTYGVPTSEEKGPIAESATWRLPTTTVQAGRSTGCFR